MYSPSKSRSCNSVRATVYFKKTLIFGLGSKEDATQGLAGHWLVSGE